MKLLLVYTLYHFHCYKLSSFSLYYYLINNIDLIRCFSNLQKYIEEKVSPEEKIEWAKVHIGKGFAGKIWKDYWSHGPTSPFPKKRNIQNTTTLKT